MLCWTFLSYLARENAFCLIFAMVADLTFIYLAPKGCANLRQYNKVVQSEKSKALKLLATITNLQTQHEFRLMGIPLWDTAVDLDNKLWVYAQS